MTRVASIAAPYGKRRLSVNLTRTQGRAIEALLSTGLFGFNRSDLVRRLIDEKLRTLVLEGWIAKPRAGR